MGVRRDAVAVVRDHASSALAAGIDPASAQADPVVAAVMTQYARVCDCPDDVDLRPRLLTRLEAANDPRRERYLQLLSVINGWPARKAWRRCSAGSPRHCAPGFSKPAQVDWPATPAGRVPTMIVVTHTSYAAPEVLHYTAFTREPGAGNPAGIVFDDGPVGLSAAAMLGIADEVGYSETAFLCPLPAEAGVRHYAVRYFSPKAEVPFCGHATIASAVAIADRHGVGEICFHTQVGEVPVHTAIDSDGFTVATLTSVPTRVAGVAGPDVAEALASLNWASDDLDPRLPPRVAYGGAHHLVLAAGSRERLADLAYDFERLRELMRQRDWTTVALVWREAETLFHVRNPFPVGGVVEDPATGAAAAALGGYLRALGLVKAPATLTLRQGEDMGQPSLLSVDIPADGLQIRVSGNAVAMRTA